MSPTNFLHASIFSPFQPQIFSWCLDTLTLSVCTFFSFHVISTILLLHWLFYWLHLNTMHGILLHHHPNTRNSTQYRIQPDFHKSLASHDSLTVLITIGFPLHFSSFTLYHSFRFNVFGVFCTGLEKSLLFIKSKSKPFAKWSKVNWSKSKPIWALLK